MLKSKLLVLMSLLILGCNGLSSVYKNKEIKDVPEFIETINESKERKKILKKHNFVNIINYLPKNFVKNGTKDYTQYLQKALTENLFVKFPDFPILINDKGLDIKNNTILVFDEKTQLLLKPSNKTNYEILRIHHKENITIFSPKIIGDKYTHLNKKGEWGMGISIKSSKNINIINPIIEKCWGDGIYLGQSGNKTNKNIFINYGLLNDNRRNGISVISANGLTIENMVIANTKGTNPQAGIDFEPNKNNEKLQNILIRNLYTYKNKNQGMFFVFGALKGTKDSISISVNNFVSNYSKKSIGFHNMKNETIKGSVKIDNFKSLNSNSKTYYFKNSVKGELKMEVLELDKK